MCGIAGFMAAGQAGGARPEELLSVMGGRLRHRGPDSGGCWFDAQTGTGFSHRRLAIQDLGSGGAQPMHSASGRYVIIFNGEIYNFPELRTELAAAGHTFRGHSDTEVMLAMFEQVGVRAALERFTGMFAFAALDRHERRLWLARDRMGEKPLYYGWHRNGTLLFASELHALRVHPDFDDRIDRDALALLLKHNYIPAPFSIFTAVRKLEPGCVLSVRCGAAGAERVERYWELARCYRDVSRPPDRRACLDELERLLLRAIDGQMIADVPLGAFLSGGIDSSLIVALMQSRSDRPVRTFTVGFSEPGFNEAEHAAAVARHLGTDHTELYVQAADARDVVPLLPSIYDEPFADSSQLPTFLIARLARGSVTVALSGDGGDELFCGYPRYFSALRDWQRRRGMAARVRAAAFSTVPEGLLASLVPVLLPGQRGYSRAHVQEKLRREARLAGAGSLQQYYDTALSYWAPEEGAVRGAGRPQTTLAGFPAAAYAGDPLREMMLLDALSYLPDDILVKVDRAAMASSLETRIPFLDRAVVEFAATVPADLHCSGGTGKLLLRELLYRHVPADLVDRPKQGFAVPVAQWLLGSLRDWAEDLLDERRLAQQGLFDVALVRRVWREHLAGDVDHAFRLWGILCFQAWHAHPAGTQAAPAAAV